MTDPNQAQVTEEMVQAGLEALSRFGRTQTSRTTMREALKAALNLSRPAADRGQIVEECAQAAEQHASQYDHQNDYQENALWNECYEVAAAIRALSPAPAQTEE